MKLGGLSAPCADVGIHLQLGGINLEKSTIHSAVDLTAPCSFPKRSSQVFPEEYFPLRSPLPPEFPKGGRDSCYNLELDYISHVLTSVDE